MITYITTVKPHEAEIIKEYAKKLNIEAPKEEDSFFIHNGQQTRNIKLSFSYTDEAEEKCLDDLEFKLRFAQSVGEIDAIRKAVRNESI